MNDQELADQLEALVDARGLSAVLVALSEVCYGKAEHLVSNWQEKPASNAWAKSGNAIAKATTRIQNDYGYAVGY